MATNKMTQLVMPFSNNGLVQRIDPGMLGPGQYYRFSNMMSTQEGAIVSRLGSQNVSPGLSPTLTTSITSYIVHSLSKMRISSTDTLNPRYIGYANKIYKTYPGSDGLFSTATDVAVDSGDSDYLGLDNRWQAAQYNAGQQSTPNIYFATPTVMMRDGTSVQRLQQWGVDAPYVPVLAVAGYGGYDTTSNSIKALWSPTVASDTYPRTRCRVVASGINQKYTYAGFVGYYTITYGASIYAGTSQATTYPSYEMFLSVDGATWSPIAVLGGNVAAATFDIWWPFNTTITAGTTFFHEMRGPVTSSAGLAFDAQAFDFGYRDFSYSDPVYPASADSNELGGYQTDDFLNMSLWMSNPESLVELRVQLYVAPSAGALAADYYLKTFVISPATGVVQSGATLASFTTQAAATLAGGINLGIYGGYDPSLIGQPGYDLPGNIGADPTTLLSQVSPGQLTPVIAGQGTIGSYFDLSWRKSEMIAVGRAGQPGYNWKNVTVGYIEAHASNSSAVIVMCAGPCWARGGYGLDTTIPGSFPYDYLITNRDPKTSHEGDPSVPMVQESWLGIQAPLRRCGAGLILRGFSTVINNGPQLSDYTGSGSVAIYRRGGQFSDGLYRLTQYVANPGSPATPTFIADTVPDYQIVAAPILQFDNDRPVTSTLPVAFTATVSAAVGSTVALANQSNVVTVNIATGALSQLRTGSLVHFDVGAKAEDVRLLGVDTTASTIAFYAQRTHVQTVGGIPVEVDTVVGQPCDLVCQAHDAIYLAGDVNNPHVLYRSKTGTPESFPVINDVTKQSHQVPVGSPSNPIMGICEFNGDLICLNLTSIYIVKVWQGIMQAPLESPAQRGLFVKRAFAKGVNSIYYLSSDGVYEWSGGTATKISEQIDWVFRDRKINGIAPMGRTEAALNTAVIAYHQNQLYLTIYTTPDGYRTFRYDALFNRWADDYELDSSNFVMTYSAYLEEQDTNRLYAALQPALPGQSIRIVNMWEEGTIGATDGYSLSPGLDGSPTYYEVVTPFFTAGAPSLQKLFADAVIEYQSPATNIAVEVLYDFVVPPTGIGGSEAFILPGDNGTAFVQSGGTFAAQLTGPTWSQDLIGTTIMVGNTFATSYASRTIVYVSAPNVLGVDSPWPFTNIAGDSYLFRRQRVPISFVQSIQGGLPVSNGREAYAVAFRFTPVAPNSNRIPTSLYSLTLNYAPLDQVQRGKVTDWNDLGYPYDKQLDVLSIEYELPFGITVPVEIWLDVMQGIAGGTTLNSGVAKFQIGTGSLGSNVRHKESLQIQNFINNQKIICKLVRLRPVQQAMNIQIFEWNIQHKQYPPDTILFTEPDDAGSPYDKYFTQLILEVDTGNVPATVSFNVDGAAAQFIALATSEADRVRTFSLVRGITGKTYNLAVTPGAGGKFQLFKQKVITEPADKGPVIHSHDWDDLGYPYDKHFYYVTFEYEVLADTTMAILGLAGISGPNQGIATAALIPLPNTSGERRKVQFRFIDGSIYKMVRFAPIPSQPTWSAKIYKPEYQFEKYPPDIVPYTELNDYGTPFLKYFQELVMDVDTGNTQGQTIVQIDGINSATFAVATSAQSRTVNFTLPGNNLGRMARLLNTAATASPDGKFQLFSHNFITLPADKGPVLHTYDWDDCGHPYDKHFYEATLEFDVTSTISQALIVAGVTGVIGQQATVSMGAITISGVFGRIKRQFSFPTSLSQSVAKMIRMYPDPTQPMDVSTRIYKPEYQFEKYPADIVHYTEQTDYGSPYLKYFQQMVLDVDTGGIAAQVFAEVDGAIQQTLSVTTTALSRNKTLTLNPVLTGRMARILANAGSNGKFQLFSGSYITLPADKGPVLHSFDWDDLGWPYDKRLKEVTIEYDTASVDTTIWMDTIVGTLGRTHVTHAQTFALGGVGRAQQTFPIQDGQIVKMVKLYPASTTVDFREWKYKFDFERMPADIALFTEWTDLDYKCEKIIREITIDCDTGGRPTTIELQADGATVYTFQITGTSMDRVTINTVPSNIIGRMFRLKLTPGAGGKAQLFSYKFERILEPCYLTHWDSYEQSFGSNGFKFIKQIWLEYICQRPITFSIYRDDGQLFYVATLPAHPFRQVERFYLPKQFLVNGIQAYNKSKVYRFVLDSTLQTPSDTLKDPFKFYRDASRIETRNLSQDERSGYLQSYLFSTMPIPV